VLSELMTAAKEDTSVISSLAVAASFAGGLAGALVGGLVKLAGDKRARKVASQLKALYELQEALFAYRGLLMRIGDDVMTLDQATEWDQLDSRLGIAIDRVRSDAVRIRYEQWRETADLAWPGAEEVLPSQEVEAWDALRAEIARELRGLDA